MFISSAHPRPWKIMIFTFGPGTVTGRALLPCPYRAPDGIQGIPSDLFTVIVMSVLPTALEGECEAMRLCLGEGQSVTTKPSREPPLRFPSVPWWGCPWKSHLRWLVSSKLAESVVHATLFGFSSQVWVKGSDFTVPVQVTHYSSSAWQTHQAKERKVMPSIHVEMCSSEFRLELFTCCSSHIFKFWWTCILLILFSIVIWVSSWTIRQGKPPDTLKYILQAQAPKPSTHGNVAQVNNQKLVDPHETPGHVAHLWHSVEPLRRLGWLFVLAFHRCVHWSSHCAGNGEVPFSANEFHPLRKRKAGAMPGNHSGNQNHGLEAIDKCFFWSVVLESRLHALETNQVFLALKTYDKSDRVQH